MIRSGDATELSVLLVAHFYPPHPGRIEAVAREEATRLGGLGASVRVLTSAVGAVAGLRAEDGVAVRRVPAWTGLGRRGVPFPVFAPSLVVHAWREIRRADVVHVHDALYVSSWVTALLCRFLGRPYVVTQHVDVVFHRSRIVRVVQGLVRRTTGAMVLRGAGVVYSSNDLVARDTRPLVGRYTRMRVLRNGVNPVRYRPAADRTERELIRCRFGLPTDETLVLYVGRFVPEKGFDTLASSRPQDCRLVFVGGDRPAQFADSRHVFLGRLEHEDVAVLYRAVDLFVSASAGEVPMTVLEALASGTPVLLDTDARIDDIGLPREAVAIARMEDGGLAEVLDRLVKEQDRLRELAQRGRQALDHGWSWDAHVRGLVADYSKVIAGRESAGQGRRTRVAVVTPYYSPRVGGVESYTSQLVRTLRDSDSHDVVVVTTGPSRRMVTERQDGVTVIRLGTWFRVSNTPVSPLWVFQLPRILRRHRVNVVSAHSPVPFLADVATFTSGRRTVVLTYHAGSLVKGVGGPVDALLRVYERAVLPRVFARADRLVAVSPVASSYRTGRAILVPPGVDTKTFRAVPEVRSARIVFVGRVERTSRWKGLDVLLEAFALVVARLPAAELHVVGDGDDVARLAAVAEKRGCAGRVTWCGTLLGQALVSAYQQATVVVLPSLNEAESFGMTLIEAMACGRPVVASRVGGIPFVVRDGVDGLLVPAGDPAALAQALVTLLRDPDMRQRMGQAGRREAEDRWDWAHRTEEMVQVLSTAAG